MKIILNCLFLTIIFTSLYKVNTHDDSDYFELTTNTINIHQNARIETNVIVDYKQDSEEKDHDNNDNDSKEQNSSETHKESADNVFQSFCRLSINEMVLPINQDDTNDGLVLKVHEKDDILYECEFPDHSISSNHTWFLNEKKIDTIESQLNLNIDRKIYKNGSHINVKCQIISSKNEKIEIKFPILQVDAYIFKYDISSIDYLIKYKYKSLLNVLKINFLMTIIIASLFLLASTVAFLRSKNKSKQKSSAYEPVQT